MDAQASVITSIRPLMISKMRPLKEQPWRQDDNSFGHHGRLRMSRSGRANPQARSSTSPELMQNQVLGCRGHKEEGPLGTQTPAMDV